jgi:hypothetical protein
MYCESNSVNECSECGEMGLRVTEIRLKGDVVALCPDCNLSTGLRGGA